MDPDDLPAAYHANNDALCALARGLDDDALGMPVPATPAWSVQDVLAHQAGVAADVLGRHLDGAPGDAWTSRQVAERAGRTAVEIADELAGHAEAMTDQVAATVAAGRPPAMLWDIACHHADLHEALGRGQPSEPLWRGSLEGRLAMVPDAQQLLEEGVEPYELFRVVFSRRSRSQVRALAPSLTDEQRDALGAFGAREDDQPVPDPDARSH